MSKPGGVGPQDHWAWIRPVSPEPPRVNRAGWARNPIDLFVLAALEKAGLGPSPEADRYTLIHRVSLDLIGLPPTPDEVAQFASDPLPDAYERLVDRRLSDPAFGERWARMWLDLARYADSDGYEKDSPRPTAYLYRNWVIDAFNHDQPYDEFMREQIAGDLIAAKGPPEKYAPRVVATGFLALARQR